MSAPLQSEVTRQKRVFLVDDHPILREGLTLLINQEPELVVCGFAEETQSVLESITTLAPDILILDISLRGPDGLEVLKAIRVVDRALPILVLSMHDETVYAERALRAGANGYITKQEATEKVLVAIRRVLRGETYVSDRIASTVLQQMMLRRPHDELATVSNLSDRELEVFRLIGFGQGTREIAEALHLSVKTIESYQAHIKEKLGIRTSRGLIQRAIEWRLSETA